MKCEARFLICLHLPEGAWDLGKNNLCKYRNICWIRVKYIVQKIFMLTYHLMKCTEQFYWRH